MIRGCAVLVWLLVLWSSSISLHSVIIPSHPAHRDGDISSPPPWPAGNTCPSQSPGTTWDHLASPGITWHHLVSPGVFWGRAPVSTQIQLTSPSPPLPPPSQLLRLLPTARQLPPQIPAPTRPRVRRSLPASQSHRPAQLQSVRSWFGGVREARFGQGRGGLQLQQRRAVSGFYLSSPFGGMRCVGGVDTDQLGERRDLMRNRIKFSDLLGAHGVPLASNQVEFSLLRLLPEKSGLLEEMKKRNIAMLACKGFSSIHGSHNGQETRWSR